MGVGWGQEHHVDVAASSQLPPADPALPPAKATHCPEADRPMLSGTGSWLCIMGDPQGHFEGSDQRRPNDGLDVAPPVVPWPVTRKAIISRRRRLDIPTWLVRIL